MNDENKKNVCAPAPSFYTERFTFMVKKKNNEMCKMSNLEADEP